MNYGYTVDKDTKYQAFFEFTLPMGELNYT